METNSATWQQRFGLTTCAALEINPAIPPTAQGVAVIYARTDAGEKILLVIESRTSGLRQQCEKRLQTGKLPPVDQLTVSFQGTSLSNPTPEEVNQACREQVIFAGELRRELRPAMR